MTCRCGKAVSYPDRVAALLALARLQRQDKAGHEEKRAYRCKYNRWHLTKK